MNRPLSVAFALSVLFALSAFSGASPAFASEGKEQRVHEEVKDETIKDENYYNNFYKISEEQKEARLERIDIKYPESKHLGQYIKTLVVNDQGVFKIIPVIEMWDLNNKEAVFYDMFTEEMLFDYPFDDLSQIKCEIDATYGNYTKGYDFSKIANAIPYFDDKTIEEFGVCFYAQTFFEKHLNDLSNRDNIEYVFDLYAITDLFYTRPYDPDASLINTYEYAKYYVTSVPLENQVTSAELGLKSTYRKEDKYSDYWKKSDDEIERCLNYFCINNESEILTADRIDTLILEDNDGNYKVMNVRMSYGDSGYLSIYDFYSGILLFDLKTRGKIIYDNRNEEYVNIDKTEKYNSIQYFEDKKIVKIDSFLACVHFVEDYYSFFVERDHIKYRPVETTYYYYTHLGKDSYYLFEISMSKINFARYYIISLPDDLQVKTTDIMSMPLNTPYNAESCWYLQTA